MVSAVSFGNIDSVAIRISIEPSSEQQNTIARIASHSSRKSLNSRMREGSEDLNCQYEAKKRELAGRRQRRRLHNPIVQ